MVGVSSVSSVFHSMSVGECVRARACVHMHMLARQLWTHRNSAQDKLKVNKEEREVGMENNVRKNRN